MSNKELFDLAIKATEESYSPYSSFRVGAALLCKSGNIYIGANIENAAYSATVCAERTAFFEAIKKQERDFEKIAVAAFDKDGNLASAPPCGVCRQVMSEFCGGDFEIVLSPDKSYTLDELLPLRFK